MQAQLPSLTYQKRKLFRPTSADVNYVYKIANKHIFNSQLVMPDIVLGQSYKYWGYCQWNDDVQNTGSYCTVKLSDKWFCQQWFVNTLVHEMVHQYQWDIYRWEHYNAFGKFINTDSGGHGPSFFVWRDICGHFDISLKTAHGQKRWFRYQQFDRC
jgi:hypothetical protein